MKNMKKFLIPVVIVLVLAAGGYYYWNKQQRLVKETVPVAVDIAEVAGTQAVTPAVASADLNLKMAFYTQAPFSNWDMPWQEACEEASMLLVANQYFHHGWTRENFRDEILKIVEWETKTFGDYKDTTVKEIAQTLKEYLGLQSVVHENPTFEDVKTVLNKGHFIVMTFAGKEIGNPNYRNGGPLYHVMVIKGYKTTDGVQKIITEDVGTRNGEDYVYNWSTLQHALHDFDSPIDNGGKFMIEVLPPALPEN